MKMTGLEWRYLQGIALDHPYFDTHELPLTEKEAKAVVEANNTMSGREFVDSVYAKLGMTRPQEEKKRLAKLRGIGELFSVPPIRKIAIAVLVIVLMTVFFAATPTGRAIADSVIEYFVTMFDDGRVAFYRNDSEVMANPVDSIHDSGEEETQEQEDVDIHIGSFEELVAAMDKQPVILPYPCTKLYYEYDESVDYLRLYAKYETPKGMISTSQIWGAETMTSTTSTGYTAYEADPFVYYSVEKDGSIAVVTSIDNSILTVCAKGSFSVDDVISLLTGE